LAEEKLGSQRIKEQQKAMHKEQKELSAKLKMATENLAWCSSEKQRSAIQLYFDGLCTQLEALGTRLQHLTIQTPQAVEQAVDQALRQVCTLRETVSQPAWVTNLIQAVNARLYVKFIPQMQRRKINTLVGERGSLRNAQRVPRRSLGRRATCRMHDGLK
jgi:hypothetical protein